MAIEVGQLAPDFTLMDQDANEVNLASFRGQKNVILIFYYTAFSSTCVKELHELQGAVGEAVQKGAEVFLVSCDSRQTLRAFKQYEGLGQTLLSDWWPHGRVAQEYGVFDAKAGGALRATVVIDTAGKVVYFQVKPIPEGRSLDDYLVAIATCPIGNAA